jgi:hypothetical protein
LDVHSLSPSTRRAPDCFIALQCCKRRLAPFDAWTTSPVSDAMNPPGSNNDSLSHDCRSSLIGGLSGDALQRARSHASAMRDMGSCSRAGTGGRIA